jgi:hypothetical protein
MAPIMAIGQAAGTAAALSFQNNISPQQLDVKHLQKTLLSQGMVLHL